MINNHYTVSEVAQKIGVTPETVRRYIREGKLKATKEISIGMKKIWVISHEELQNFIAKLNIQE